MPFRRRNVLLPVAALWLAAAGPARAETFQSSPSDAPLDGAGEAQGGCGCGMADASASGGWAATAAMLALAFMRRRKA